MTVRLVPARPIVHQPEHVLWTLMKDARQAEARVRLTPIGMEVRFFIYDAGTPRDRARLYYSRIFRPQDGGTAALHDEALLRRREFEVRGWTTVESHEPDQETDTRPKRAFTDDKLQEFIAARKKDSA